VSCDEKGYLVTEMVLEEVTDDEREDMPVIAAKPVSVETNVKKQNSSKKAASQPVNQKSMTSFFSKK